MGSLCWEAGGGGGVEAPGFELWLGEGEEEVSRIGM